jgi:uncharacterized repeat protein (TIGR03803 family)
MPSSKIVRSFQAFIASASAYFSHRASAWIRVFTLALFCGSVAMAASAQTFTVLHSFNNADGSNPIAGLIQSTDGNFYGTTYLGGANSTCVGGCGTVFKITSEGTLTTVYNFCSQSGCTDGNTPEAGLIQATDGNFYGTTEYGGATNGGTVFLITPTGALTTLYNFCSQSGCRDGINPNGGLVQGTDGNFYGTTQFGGISDDGTVFKITASGTLTTLHSFAGTDGTVPAATLVQGTDGNFYGTTEKGGAYMRGSVFKITQGGMLTTLYSFCRPESCGGGEYPYAALVQGTDGNFYGTTAEGGDLGLYGTVFKITSSGQLTTLFSFCPGRDCKEGSAPTAPLVQATDGYFYGTTFAGGTNSVGTLFKIKPSGTLKNLYSFCRQSGCPNGERPAGALVQGTDGNFYGTTELGGISSHGTVFSLSVGLAPFVEANPTTGKIGSSVSILGTNLTGATSVTFNGTAATFTVVSSSEITTTVPIGATSGMIQVVTPVGTLSSNVRFRVGS